MFNFIESNFIEYEGLRYRSVNSLVQVQEIAKGEKLTAQPQLKSKGPTPQIKP